MTITCDNYTARSLPNGKICLTLDQALISPLDDQLSLQEIGRKLKKTVKAIDALSRRKKDPLPLRRGKGRPFAFRTELERWLAAIRNDRADREFYANSRPEDIFI